MKRFERYGFWILVILISIMSLTSVVAARQATDTAKKTDLIVQCTTPGTTCSKLQAEGQLRNAAQTMCIVLIELPPAAERDDKRDEIISSYQACVTDIFNRLKVAPLPGIGTTPTTVGGTK